jgi:hypothetical protein
VVHHDDHTKVTVKTIEELPPVQLPLDPEIVHFPEEGRATGRVVFMEMEVNSDKVGQFRAPVIYVFAENEPFCARKIMPCGGQTTHVIHIRYTGCGGGGRASGGWLLNVLLKLKCEVFITDGHHEMQEGDWAAIRLYPELGGPEDAEGAGAGVQGRRRGGEPHGYHLECIRRIKGERWSGHGDVTWSLVVPG